MLIGLDPILSPQLLYILRAMGHGDRIVIADANFPGDSCASKLVRLDGVDASRALKAVLSVMPLDTYAEDPAISMQVVGDPSEVPEAVADFQRIIDETAGTAASITPVERFAFYEAAKSAYAVVQTGERRFYGNIILTKGVVPA
ncbi:L-fucose mutarotase [Aliiruegeria haliotis]|uniref:L-fucose mutarotase n=1 Tax=Aliiruegeria haliotis TaxID=1280846 RepID=A0A2T0RMY9_9RHOB|nr:RbsD/FucU domain-containing protein [Aliiruegeria haliotis]PRY22490.1 L-fucose mutarotase [Aliiruegeria haliotis]